MKTFIIQKNVPSETTVANGMYVVNAETAEAAYKLINSRIEQVFSITEIQQDKPGLIFAQAAVIK